MYKQQIKEYIEAHKQEMLEDIATLCRINSEKMAYKVGMPFGEGTFRALGAALSMAEKYGFATTNYDSYVGTVDFGALELPSGYSGSLRRSSGRRRLDGNRTI